MTYDQDRLRRTHLEKKEVCPWRVAGTKPVLTCAYGEPGYSTCQAGQAESQVRYTASVGHSHAPGLEQKLMESFNLKSTITG